MESKLSKRREKAIQEAKQWYWKWKGEIYNMIQM